MKDIKKVITEAVQSGSKNFIKEAVSQLLGEDITAGQKVAVIDDTINGFAGLRATVKRISDSNPGFAECETENGTILQLQTSLLVPV